MSNKTAHMFESLLLALDFHSATPQTASSRNGTFFYSIFRSLRILCLSPLPFLLPSKSFLSLWQVSHSIARKDADIPNFRYSPNLFAFYLPGIHRFQNRDFLMEQELSNAYLKKKKTTQQTQNTTHFLLTVVFK